MTQALCSQNDLPHSRSADALAQCWLCRVNNCLRDDLLDCSLLCPIDERAVSARDHEVDVVVTQITQYSRQNFLCFPSLPIVAAWMSTFDCDGSLACENDCSCAFAQDHSSVLFAERLNRRRVTRQTPSSISVA